MGIQTMLSRSFALRGREEMTQSHKYKGVCVFGWKHEECSTGSTRRIQFFCEYF